MNEVMSERGAPVGPDSSLYGWPPPGWTRKSAARMQMLSISLMLLLAQIPSTKVCACTISGGRDRVIERTFLLHANLADPSSGGSDIRRRSRTCLQPYFGQEKVKDVLRLEFLKMTM
jgi:hypothetical protein